MTPEPPPAATRTRVVVLCCEGFYQRQLVQRAASAFDLVGVVLQHPPRFRRRSLRSRLSRYRDPAALLRQLEARWHLPAEEARGLALRQQLFPGDGQGPAIPQGVAELATDAINGPETVAFLRDCAPDLILVNGTQLLREPVLQLRPMLRYGILNLHTGLSPYARGANCNLYMILEGHPEFVGVTIHHIDPGIDSGEIIRSAQVPLQADDNFETIDVRSFQLGIELLIEAALQQVAGRAARIPQWEKGKLFLQRTGYHYEPWQRLEASRRLKRGLLADYLAHKAERDAAVKVVGVAASVASAEQERGD